MMLNTLDGNSDAFLADSLCLINFDDEQQLNPPQPQQPAKAAPERGERVADASSLKLPELPAKATTPSTTTTTHMSSLDAFDIHFNHQLSLAMKSHHDSILAEYLDAKRSLVSHSTAQTTHLRETHESIKLSLLAEITALKSQLKASESKITHRSNVVEAMAQFLLSRRRRLDLQGALLQWHAKTRVTRITRLLTKHASQHHKHTLLRKILYGWQSAVGITFKRVIEKRVRLEAEKHIQFMSLEYENRIKALNEQLDRTVHELNETREMQAKMEEDMKRSYLRGVSALNMEAMGIFKKSKSHAAACGGGVAASPSMEVLSGMLAEKEVPQRVSFNSLVDSMNQPRVDRNMERIVVPGSARGGGGGVTLKEERVFRNGNGVGESVAAVSRTKGLVTRHFVRD